MVSLSPKRRKYPTVSGFPEQPPLYYFAIFPGIFLESYIFLEYSTYPMPYRSPPSLFQSNVYSSRFSCSISTSILWCCSLLCPTPSELSNSIYESALKARVLHDLFYVFGLTTPFWMFWYFYGLYFILLLFILGNSVIQPTWSCVNWVHFRFLSLG